MLIYLILNYFLNIKLKNIKLFIIDKICKRLLPVLFENNNLLMKFSIIINTHDQEQYLERSINSCLIQKVKSYEIIIVDTSKKKNYKIRKKYKKNKIIKFLDLKSKFIHPERNQLYKILRGLRTSSGKYILLLDGDDYFSSTKLSIINNLLKKNIDFSYNQDLPILFNEYNKKEMKILNRKFYKNFKLFHFLINKWPQVFTTSSITVKREILINFFKNTKPFKWKFLAIDIQLTIYCNLFYKIISYGKNITYKSVNKSNLGEKYMNYFSKKYWIRRDEQHKYYLSLNKKIGFEGFDYYLTKLLVYLIK